MPSFRSAALVSVLLSTVPNGVSIRAPFLPASTCDRLAIRHTPNPITAPPSTMTPIMMATTKRMTFRAPPPEGGAVVVAGSAVAAAGLAAAAAAIPPLAGVALAAPATTAPHLVQNFDAPSSVAPQDVQKAITHL